MTSCAARVAHLAAMDVDVDPLHVHSAARLMSTHILPTAPIIKCAVSKNGHFHPSTSPTFNPSNPNVQAHTLGSLTML